MTLDELIKEVNAGWGWANVELTRNSDDHWTAHFQCIDVWEAQQPFFKCHKASEALDQLVYWLRGKTVYHRATSGGVGGRSVKVPDSLVAGCRVD